MLGRRIKVWFTFYPETDYPLASPQLKCKFLPFTLNQLDLNVVQLNTFCNSGVRYFEYKMSRHYEKNRGYNLPSIIYVLTELTEMQNFIFHSLWCDK